MYTKTKVPIVDQLQTPDPELQPSVSDPSSLDGWYSSSSTNRAGSQSQIPSGKAITDSDESENIVSREERTSSY